MSEQQSMQSGAGARRHLGRLGVVIVISVLAGTSIASAEHVFEDVPHFRFYAEAVEWAAENGITSGRTPTHFDPEAELTRGESLTFLKRYDDYLADTVLDLLPSEVVLRTEERTVPPGSVFFMRVGCGPDDEVIGGGYVYDGPGLKASYPLIGEQGIYPHEPSWYVGGVNLDDVEHDVQAWATCMVVQ